MESVGVMGLYLGAIYAARPVGEFLGKCLAQNGAQDEVSMSAKFLVGLGVLSVGSFLVSREVVQKTGPTLFPPNTAHLYEVETLSRLVGRVTYNSWLPMGVTTMLDTGFIIGFRRHDNRLY